MTRLRQFLGGRNRWGFFLDGEKIRECVTTPLNPGEMAAVVTLFPIQQLSGWPQS